MINKIINVLKKERTTFNDNDFCLWAEDDDLIDLANKLKAAISVTRCSTQLLCVNKGDDNGITKGLEYKCIDRNKTHYRIVDNYSYEGWFAKEHFKEIT